MSSSSGAGTWPWMWRGRRFGSGRSRSRWWPWRSGTRCPPTRRRSPPRSRKGSRSTTAGGRNGSSANGTVTGIELKECTRVFDENRRFSPAYDENNLKTIEADQIIVAIGQAVHPDLLNHCGLATGRGCFTADPVTLETSAPGIFAGGENATGPGERHPGRGRGQKGRRVDRTLPLRQGAPDRPLRPTR